QRSEFHHPWWPFSSPELCCIDYRSCFSPRLRLVVCPPWVSALLPGILHGQQFYGNCQVGWVGYFGSLLRCSTRCEGIQGRSAGWLKGPGGLPRPKWNQPNEFGRNFLRLAP